MRFEEALQAMCEGKIAIGPYGDKFKIDNGRILVKIYEQWKDIDEYENNLISDELLSDDWEIIDD